MTSPDTLKPGDVVQLDPATAEAGSFFAGCFMLVTKVTSWGAMGFICMPTERGQMPGRAYFRANHGDMERIGIAAWIDDDDSEVPKEQLPGQAVDQKK